QRVEKIAEILSIGDIIKAKIIDIDVDKKRVSLSMRALLAEDEQKRDREIIDQAVADGLVEVSTEEVLTESTKEQPAE
ncbi:MAG: S1 RNA-binding domain-containing protein, partial [Oscillospiraceae bacterium]